MNNLPTRIVVPTDFSETASHALRYASALAERFHAEILVIHANPFIGSVMVTPVTEFALSHNELVRANLNRLEAYAKAIIDPVVHYKTRVIVTEPVNAILETCQGSTDLVIMGTHGDSALVRTLFGSVTAAVMRLASVPVIAVNRSAATGPIRNAICLVTATPVCDTALRYAVNLCEEKVILVPAVANQDLQRVVKDLIRLQDSIPSQLADRCGVTIAGIDFSADQIVKLARTTEANLIVMEVPADHRVLDFIGGTIAEKVVAHSGCPVLTVNARAAQVLEGAREELMSAV